MQTDFVRTPAAMILFILTLGSFSLGMAEFTTIWLMPEIAKDLGTSLVYAGNAASYYALGVVVGTPILAYFSHTLSRPKWLSLLLFMCMSGNLLSSFAYHWDMFTWARFFSGLPHGMYLGLAGIILTDLFPKHSGKAIGFLMAGIGMALLVVVPLTTLIGENQDWRIIFRFVALVDLLIILLLHDLIPGLPKIDTPERTNEVQVLKNPMLWWVLAISATAICGRMAIFAYAEPLVTQITALPQTVMPIIVVLGGVGTVCGFLFGGYLADKNLSKTMLYSLIWFLVVIVAFKFMVQNSVWVFVAFFMLSTFTLIVPALQVMVVRYGTEGRTFASCLNHAFMNIANAAGPLLAGFFVGSGFGLLSVIWVGIVIGALALVVYVLGAACLLPKWQQRQSVSSVLDEG